MVIHWNYDKYSLKKFSFNIKFYGVEILNRALNNSFMDSKILNKIMAIAINKIIVLHTKPICDKVSQKHVPEGTINISLFNKNTFLLV